MAWELVVLGLAQDGGHPQAGCTRACCAGAFAAGRRTRVVSLGITDGSTRFLLDCTLDLATQLRDLGGPPLHGVLLTHAHVGHYSGLLHVGPEAWSARGLPVWAMPGMTGFLRANAPWSALETDGNVALRALVAGVEQPLAAGLSVLPRLVPHRGPWSETVGLEIRGPSKRVLYVPDLDDFTAEHDPVRWLAEVDRLYLDATFFSDDEIPWRDAAQVPHPRVADTLRRLSAVPVDDRARVRFIHLNHTNPLLDPDSPVARRLVDDGYVLAVDGERMAL